MFLEKPCIIVFYFHHFKNNEFIHSVASHVGNFNTSRAFVIFETIDDAQMAIDHMHFGIIDEKEVQVTFVPSESRTGRIERFSNDSIKNSYSRNRYPEINSYTPHERDYPRGRRSPSPINHRFRGRSPSPKRSSRPGFQRKSGY